MTSRQSVVVPVLNGATYIEDALTSALQQLSVNDEIVVVDNGSTDQTVELVGALNDPRIRLISEGRKGPAAARNAGLAVATGDLVSFLDHDDYWPAGRNAGLLAALSGAPDADAAYGRLRVLVEPGSDDQGLAALDHTFAPSVGFHAFLFRRRILEATGAMDETMKLGSDVDYLSRLRQAGMTTVMYDGDAAVYRRHRNNITLDAAEKRKGLFGAISRNLARNRISND